MTKRVTLADDTALQAHLFAAGDSRLRRVVAAVDGMARRGVADALIAPLRPRLARLRPPRPLTLTRLMFVPLDPLIVPAGTWRAGDPTVPRPAIAVLCYDLRDALGEDGEALQARFAGRTMEDGATVAECGAELWPRAAALLAARPVPAGWKAATGLSDRAHATLAGPLAILLAQGISLHRLPDLSASAAPGEAERLLRLAAPAGTMTLAMMLALLLRHLPRARRLLQVADGLDQPASGPSASEIVLRAMLGGVQDGVTPQAPLPEAAETARRIAAMLEDLHAAVDFEQRPARLQQVREARQRLGAQCRDRLISGAEALAAPHPGPVEARSLAAMEQTARALRRLDAVGRRLGDAEDYDRALSGAAGRLIVDTLLPPATRLRLAEILLGADAALKLMEGG